MREPQLENGLSTWAVTPCAGPCPPGAQAGAAWWKELGAGRGRRVPCRGRGRRVCPGPGVGGLLCGWNRVRSSGKRLGVQWARAARGAWCVGSAARLGRREALRLRSLHSPVLGRNCCVGGAGDKGVGVRCTPVSLDEASRCWPEMSPVSILWGLSAQLRFPGPALLGDPEASCCLPHPHPHSIGLCQRLGCQDGPHLLCTPAELPAGWQMGHGRSETTSPAQLLCQATPLTCDPQCPRRLGQGSRGPRAPGQGP